MRAHNNEFIEIFLRSKSTQWALIFGTLVSMGILFVGDHYLEALSSGPSAFQDIFRPIIAGLYVKAAAISFVGTLWIAGKFYRRDRRRLLGLR